MSVPSEADYVCALCGSGRLGVLQRGIDNWFVAQCYACGPKTPIIPEGGGEKRQQAINTAARKRVSRRAIHSILRPVVLRSEYRPPATRKTAPTVGMFD